MVVLPPRSPRPAQPASGLSILEDELAQERASSLGRLGRALEKSLADLAAFDQQRAHGAEPGADDQSARHDLVATAGYALWLFVVQRESCGLRDLRQVLRDYRIPADVYHRMGVFPGNRKTSRR